MNNSNKQSKTTNLRQKAETLLRINSSETGLPLSEIETLKLVHELEVHQIELELINEELAFQNEEKEKRASELTRSKQLLDETGRLARIGGWEIVLKNMELSWTDVVYEIHEVEPDYQLTVESGINFYAPEAIPVISEAVRRAIEEGKSFDIDLQLITAKQNKIWIRAIGQAYRVNGEIVKIGGMIQDITGRKQAEDLLIKSEEKFRDMVEQINDVIFTTDNNGIFTYLSPAVEILGGYKPEDMIGHFIGEFLDPLFVPMIIEQFQKVMTGILEPMEYRVKVKSGDYQWVRSSSKPILKENIQTGIRGVLTDITERKRAEKALQESEKLYHSLFENMLNGFAYCKVLFNQEQVQDFVYLEVNDAFEKLTGLKDVVGKKITEIIPGIRENDKELFKIFGQVALTGKPVTLEIYLASLREWHSISVYSPRKGYFVSVFDVITERKQAEKKLQESEERFRSLYENSTVGIYRTTPDGQILLANPTLVKLLGYSSFEKLSERNLEKEGFGPSYERTHFKDALKREGEVKGLESAWTRMDGTTLFISESARAINDKEGKIIYYDGIVEDITLRKKAEQELIITNKAFLQSEENFRRSISESPLGIRIISIEGETIYVNKAFLDIYQYNSLEEFRSIPTINRYTPESYVQHQIRKERNNNGHDVFDYEVSIVRENAEVRYVKVWRKEVLWNGVKHFQTFNLDITEQKRAEETLDQERILLRTIIDNFPISIFVKDKKYRKIVVNFEHARRVTAHLSPAIPISVDDLLGKTDFEVYSRELAEEFLIEDQKVIEGGQSVLNRELLSIDANGRAHWELISKIPLRDRNSEIIGLVGISNDISGHKLAEQALLQSEENFHRSISESPLGIRIISVDEKTIYANKAFLDIFEFNSIEEFTSTPALNRYTPESFTQHLERKEKRKNGHEVFDYEISIINKNAEVRYLKVWRKEVLWNGTKHYQVINLDITEQKRAEEVVKESEEKYKTILNASPDGILLTDLKGIITEVSEIGLELFGTNTRDDLVGKKFLSIFPSEEKNTIKEIIEKTRIEGLTQNIELKIRKKNHSLFLSEISATLIQYPYGTPLSFMMIIRDISQRKEMEIKQMHADRMANLGEMASGIAHEINQPLNIISMVMDKILFESSETNSIDIEFLKIKSDKIFENITRIKNIIDHIRAFSRNHDDYVLTAFDINSSIENAASMVLEQFKHLGINLNFQLNKQIPQILGNTYKFEQVILNLLVNAKDAVIEKKSKKLEYVNMIIGIRSYQENQFIIVEVTDNGIGISNDDINNIMLPFYTTKEEGKGTGLGLSICYQIIKEMNGTIDITSKKYNGTKSKIVLDIQKKK